jgi:hypothetical protein
VEGELDRFGTNLYLYERITFVACIAAIERVLCARGLHGGPSPKIDQFLSFPNICNGAGTKTTIRFGSVTTQRHVGVHGVEIPRTYCSLYL